MRSLRAVLGVILVVAALVGMTGPTAWAHVSPAQGTSVIRQDGAKVRWSIALTFERLTIAAGLGKAKPAAEDDELVAFLHQRREKLTSYLDERLTVERGGVRCPVELEGTGIAWRRGYPYAVVDLLFACSSSAGGKFGLRYAMDFTDPKGVGADHLSLVDYELGGGSGRDVFDAAHQELTIGGEDDESLLSAMGRFAVLGGEHILKGFDHLLFLVLLLLGSSGWRSVLKLASAFTVAHSVTLALASLGWVDVPASVVEPLIALSIVYVAVENIRRRESGHRALVVFGFGLLHGLGFAASMSFTDDLGLRLLGSLLSFNLGIELGQLMVVVVVFPLLLLARRTSWSTAAHAAAAAGAGVLGALWFVQRVLPAAG